MDPEFEKLLKDIEKRRSEAIKLFYNKYATNDDSEEEVVDLRTLEVMPKSKKKNNFGKSFKRQKRVPPKPIKFGEMTSYCISVKSKRYIKKIKKYIKTKNQANDDSILSCEIEEYKMTESAKLIITNRIPDTYIYEKSDSSYNEGEIETLPLNCEFNLSQPAPNLNYLDNSKLDSLTCDLATISTKRKGLFPSFKKIIRYNEYFKNRSIMDPFGKELNICSLTYEPPAKYTFCNKSSKSNVEKALKFKECAVVLQRIMLPENAVTGSCKFSESHWDFKSSVKNKISASQFDDGVQKLLQEKSNRKKLLASNNLVSLQKHPSCYVKRNDNSCQIKNVALLEKSATESASHKGRKLSKNLSIGKNIRPRCLNSNLTALKPTTYDCAVQMGKDGTIYNEDKLQINTNIAKAKIANIVPSKEVCEPERKNQLKSRKISESYRAEKSSNDEDTTLSVINSDSISRKDITQYSSFEHLMNRDKNKPFTCNRENVPPKHSFSISCRYISTNGQILSNKERASPRVLDMRNKSPIVSKNSSSLEKFVEYRHHTNSCNETSVELSTGKIYCPKVRGSVITSRFLRSLERRSNSSGVTVKD